MKWLAGGAAAVVGGAMLLLFLLVATLTGGAAPAAGTGCVTGAAGGTTVELDADQKANASVIVRTGRDLGVPVKGLVVGVVTAMQESMLRNLAGGDRDSVGLFQQRPSTGWGTLAQLADPATAAALFFRGKPGNPGLLSIPGWQDMPVTYAAQAVQRSAFPDAYAKWEADAGRIVTSLTSGAGRCEERVIPAADLSQFRNGEIPDAALAVVPGHPEARLRGDAAAALAQLDQAYAAWAGEPICITDSYRSLPEQVDVYARKPGLAAKPGTSNHGWGVAVDLCGGIQSFGTAAHRWMKANAGRFGWRHPAWAEPSGSMPEPWHWEFGETKR